MTGKAQSGWQKRTYRSWYWFDAKTGTCRGIVSYDPTLAGFDPAKPWWKALTPGCTTFHSSEQQALDAATERLTEKS